MQTQRQAQGGLSREQLPIGERARDAEKVQPEGGKESENSCIFGFNNAEDLEGV